MLIISSIVFLCYIYRKFSERMNKVFTVTILSYLRKFGGLVPYIVGAFLVTSLIQMCVYDTIIHSTHSQSQRQAEAEQCDSSESDIPLWQKPTLLNLTNFHWIMTNESTCKLDVSQKDARVVVALVHTARSNFRERYAIRKSWGSLPMYRNWTLRLAFLLGEPDPTRNSMEDLKKLRMERRKLQKEQNKYGDLVIGSFIDSYHNLTYKHIMGYKFVLNFCPEAQFVIKADDDMFIDIMRWLDWRTRDMKILAKNSSEQIPQLYGFNFGGTEPQRSGKWYASLEEWPEEKYPAYCSGWGYGITVNMLQRLYNATKTAKFFWIDDVYATGVLLREVEKEEPKPKVEYLGDKMSGKTDDYRDMCESQAFYKKRKFKSVTYIPREQTFFRDMMCMWNKTLHDSKYDFKK